MDSSSGEAGLHFHDDKSAWARKVTDRGQASFCLVSALLLLVLGTFTSSAHAAEEGEHAIPHHHLAVLVGYALERKREEDENAFAFGLDYGYRYHENWAVGVFGEWLDSDTQRDYTAGALSTWHPVGGWKLFAGPGVEFTPDKNELLLRLGVGYDFELRNKWTLGANAIYDAIEGGNRTYILGIDIGREF